MFEIIGFGFIAFGFFSLSKNFLTQLLYVRNDYMCHQLEFKKFKSKISALTNSQKDNHPDFPKWQGYRNFNVSKKIIENSNCVSIYLEPEDRQLIVAPKAGQYLPIKMTPYGEIKSIKKKYTISSILEDNQYRLTVKKRAGFSEYLYDSLSIGEKIQCKMPVGDFVLDQDLRAIVFIAGGIGITPILPMLQELTKLQSKRKVYLFWGVSTLGDVILSEEFEKLAFNNQNLKLNLFISQSVKQTEKELELPQHPWLEIGNKNLVLEDEENFINLENSKLSIFNRKGKWFVKDLGSNESVLLNSKLISGIKASWRSFELKNGDKIELKTNKLIFNNKFEQKQINVDQTPKRDKLSIKNFTLHKGRMTKERIREFIDTNEFASYLCGPPSMIEDLCDFDENIKIECFNSDSEEAIYRKHKKSSLH